MTNIQRAESWNPGEGAHLTTYLRSKGQVTIPADVRRETHLDEGDPIEVEVVAEGILLKPRKIIDSTQAWFWTPSWQAGEREASEELAAGLGATYEDADEFLESLDS